MVKIRTILTVLSSPNFKVVFCNIDSIRGATTSFSSHTPLFSVIFCDAEKNGGNAEHSCTSLESWKCSSEYLLDSSFIAFSLFLRIFLRSSPSLSSSDVRSGTVVLELDDDGERRRRFFFSRFDFRDLRSMTGDGDRL